MQQRIFALHADDNSWHGPFRSPYGYHLVLMAKKTASYLPSLEDLRPRLEMDAHKTRLDLELEQIERAVVNSYSVELDDTIQGRLVKRTSESTHNIE
jgi:parvulin-like peptidyl-prolyl isomerase